ncbi:MAG: BrnA antitoxin family protein [Acidobacteriia bacterium]|nr:BrnA antitoxin family protein [Terriglobia bacterium]
MKEPKTGDLEFDVKGTRQVRRIAARKQSVKITINIDSEALAILRAQSAKTGIPYQRLLNQVLMRALQKDAQTEGRLDRLEKELNRLKRTLVA